MLGFCFFFFEKDDLQARHVGVLESHGVLKHLKWKVWDFFWPVYLREIKCSKNPRHLTGCDTLVGLRDKWKGLHSWSAVLT